MKNQISSNAEKKHWKWCVKKQSQNEIDAERWSTL